MFAWHPTGSVESDELAWSPTGSVEFNMFAWRWFWSNIQLGQWIPMCSLGIQLGQWSPMSSLGDGFACLQIEVIVKVKDFLPVDSGCLVEIQVGITACLFIDFINNT